MDNYMRNTPDSSTEFSERMASMYPDSYKRIYPHVKSTVDSLSDERMYNMTDMDIDMLTDEAIRAGNFHNDPPPGHNHSTMRDFTRALVVRDLFDRHRRHRRFPIFPFFFFPFDDRDFRDHDRDHFGRY